MIFHAADLVESRFRMYRQIDLTFCNRNNVGAALKFLSQVRPQAIYLKSVLVKKMFCEQLKLVLILTVCYLSTTTEEL